MKVDIKRVMALIALVAALATIAMVAAALTLPAVIAGGYCPAYCYSDLRLKKRVRVAGAPLTSCSAKH
jgi:hypothetical protein